MDGLTVCWPLKKGKGTSRDAVFEGVRGLWLGASPLFQRATDMGRRKIERCYECHVTDLSSI